MTDREALIEAMKCLQDLYAIVRKIADRVTLVEQVLLLTPTKPVDSIDVDFKFPSGVIKKDPPFSEIASGYQREIEAKDLRLTDAEIAEIEREIESKHMEGE